MAKKELEKGTEYEEYADYFEDTTKKDKSGQVKFKSVNHHKRAEANEVESDGEKATYVNYALEYFGYRCALSGERFIVFDNPVEREKNKRITTNLSAEHVVALSTGGNDIIPNIVPTVLQYNRQKNGYYILDWWPKAKDINGNPIYTPEKLLKIVNYMLKSLQVRRDLGIKKQPREYRKRLLAPNKIDEFLMQEEIAEELLSDTITATTEVENGKNILTQIPQQEGAIPSLTQQKEKGTKITEAMFLTDALEVLRKEERIPQEIIARLQDMYKDVEGEIPFEIEVRRNILHALEQMGIENNKYTVANDLILNSSLLEQAKNTDNSEIQSLIEEHLKKQEENLRAILPKQYLREIISYRPEILYDFESAKEEKEIIDLYIKYTDNKELEIKKLNKTNLRNLLMIKKWMEENNTTKPPRSMKNIQGEEKKLGTALVDIRRHLIKPYQKLKSEEEKAEYRRQHPELEEVMAIVEEIDKNNIPIKEEQTYYIHILAIKKWMEKNNTTKPPRNYQDKDKTVEEEEIKLGNALKSIIDRLIKPYQELKSEEEKAEYRRQHPELEEVIAMVEEIDKNNIPIKEEQPYYINILAIKKWMEDNNTTKPPRREQNKDKTVEEEEIKLGTALKSIIDRLIKPYQELKSEEEKAEYRRQHPELEEVMAIVEEIDKNNIPTYLRNALEIKKWMEENNTTKPPRSIQNKDKTVEEEEIKLGTALVNIKRQLIKPYQKLKSEEEKAEYRRQHPELEEVMAIVEEIDRNNPKNKKKIKDTIKENKDNLYETIEVEEQLETEMLVAERSASDGREK